MMKTGQTIACAALIFSLSACIADGGYAPAPYYGGVAPYYGTTYAPTYVGVYAAGTYYPHYAYHNIHSGYNNGYWHYQRNAAAHPAALAHTGGGAPAPHGGGHGGDGHR